MSPEYLFLLTSASNYRLLERVKLQIPNQIVPSRMAGSQLRALTSEFRVAIPPESHSSSVVSLNDPPIAEWKALYHRPSFRASYRGTFPSPKGEGFVASPVNSRFSANKLDGALRRGGKTSPLAKVRV